MTNRQRRRRIIKRLQSYIRHPRFFWWALTNRLKGYKFGPIRRFRCCDHTTPFHYRWCVRRPS